jgi:hypothetical protein
MDNGWQQIRESFAASSLRKTHAVSPCQYHWPAMALNWHGRLELVFQLLVDGITKIHLIKRDDGLDHPTLDFRMVIAHGL